MGKDMNESGRRGRRRKYQFRQVKRLNKFVRNISVLVAQKTQFNERWKKKGKRKGKLVKFWKTIWSFFSKLIRKGATLMFIW